MILFVYASHGQGKGDHATNQGQGQGIYDGQSCNHDPRPCVCTRPGNEYLRSTRNRATALLYNLSYRVKVSPNHDILKYPV